MQLSVLLGKPPRMLRTVERIRRELPRFDLSHVTFAEAAMRVLKLPQLPTRRSSFRSAIAAWGG